MEYRKIGDNYYIRTVLYTAEIELRPTVGGAIGRKFDPETGTGFWASPEARHLSLKLNS